MLASSIYASKIRKQYMTDCFLQLGCLLEDHNSMQMESTGNYHLDSTLIFSQMIGTLYHLGKAYDQRLFKSFALTLVFLEFLHLELTCLARWVLMYLSSILMAPHLSSRHRHLTQSALLVFQVPVPAPLRQALHYCFKLQLQILHAVSMSAKMIWSKVSLLTNLWKN